MQRITVTPPPARKSILRDGFSCEPGCEAAVEQALDIQVGRACHFVPSELLPARLNMPRGKLWHIYWPPTSW